jgi:hypothetical protein
MLPKVNLVDYIMPMKKPEKEWLVRVDRHVLLSSHKTGPDKMHDDIYILYSLLV